MTEQDQEKRKGWLRRFWSDWWGLLVGGFTLLALILVPLVLVWTGLLKTGFGEIRTSIQNTELGGFSRC